MMRTTIIYGIADPVTTELRYIGKTVTSLPRRLDAHLHNARRRLKQPCAHWIASLLAKGIRPEIFEIEVCLPGSDWEEAEQFWIENFRALGCRLLNLSIGGGAGALGWRATEATKRRMSAALTGRPVSEETRRKIGASNSGKVRSAEVCRQIADGRRGEKAPTAKITDADVPVIRALRTAGYTGSQVGSMYGITKTSCDGIFKRVTWTHIPDLDVDISSIVVPPIYRLRGNKVGTAKLNDDAIKDIRRRLAGKRGSRETGRALALEYGVTATTISDIRTRKIWRHVA
jgi:hypothetical protein